MKRLVIVFVLSSLFVPLISDGQQSDKERAGLTGPVQSVTQVPLGQGPKGEGWQEGQRIVTRYDREGREVEVDYYDRPDAGGTIYERLDHTYDSQGRRTETIHYNGNKPLARKTRYSYDEQGYLVRQLYCDAEGCFDEISYTYDPQGTLTEETSYHPGGGIRLRTEYTYDTGGHRTTATFYDAHDTGLGIAKVVETYDVTGNVSANTTYYTPKVDEEGRETPPPAPGRIIFTYEFDAKGNWVRKEEYLCGGERSSDKAECQLSAITKRTITYYPE